MVCKFFCDRCEKNQVENTNDRGQTVFTANDGKIPVVLTIQAEIGGKPGHLCMDCIREIIAE